MALVLFEKDDSVLKVSLNRTSVLNALNSAVLMELESGMKEYINDLNVKVLMLFGQGGCFASGADLKELSSFDEEGIRKFHAFRERTLSLIENFPSPTIAVIEKYALGTGLELALSCDFRIASENAKLGIPSAKIGIVESYKYTSRLVKAVGPSYAKKMIFTGEMVDAKTAFVKGLVEEVTPSDELFDRAESLISRILKNSINAVRKSKEVVEVCAKDPNLFYVNDTALPMVESFQTQDFKEGTTAFLEKREARFN